MYSDSILDGGEWMVEEEKSAYATSYRDLRVYQSGFTAAMEIFELSKRFPAEEKYALTAQIRDSSRSVCSNIAEAWRKRRYPNHFVSKLSDSDTEAAETEVWLEFALRCGYISVDDHSRLAGYYEMICAMLSRMMLTPEAWCKNFQKK